MTIAARLFASAAALSLAAPALAQEGTEDYRRIVLAMRACGTIEDVPSRVLCYDNNIVARRGLNSDAAPTPPPPARADAAPPVQGFGADLVPRERQAVQASHTQETELEVVSERRERPGVHVLTLADGGQWRFVDSADFTYEVPGPGDTIKLQRGALGSVRMFFDGQKGLRVQRIQ